MRFWKDERAQPVGILRFCMMLIFGGFMLVILQPVFNDVESVARNQSSNATAMQAMDWQVLVWNNLPLYLLAMGGFGLVVLAVYQKRRA